MASSLSTIEAAVDAGECGIGKHVWPGSAGVGGVLRMGMENAAKVL